MSADDRDRARLIAQAEALEALSRKLDRFSRDFEKRAKVYAERGLYEAAVREHAAANCYGSIGDLARIDAAELQDQAARLRPHAGRWT